MVEEEKPQIKSAEQRIQENTFQHLLTFMCGKTFSRHALLSEEEFLKEIGFDPATTTEDDAVRLSLANLLNALTSKALQIQDALKMTRNIAIIKSGKSEEEIMKIIAEKKEAQNGRK